MELYKEYIKEIVNREIIYTDKGFITYEFIPDGIYIYDVFVKKEFRKSKIAWDLLTQIEVIAKEKDIKNLFGMSQYQSNHMENALKIWTTMGFKPESANDKFIKFIKRLD